MRTRWDLLALAALLLVGCGLRPQAQTAAPSPGAADTLTEGTAPPGEPAPLPETPAPEAEPVEPGAVTLAVWMVEDLAPSDDALGGETLLSQLVAFDETHPDIQVEVQLKRVSGRGSALDYLRTAPPVAPSVLPDLVLLDRKALVPAAREGLIVPWDALADDAPLAMAGELYPAATALGRVDGALAGLPYLLEIRHTVFREPLYDETAPLSFEDVLGDLGEAPAYVFPAAPATGLSLNRTTLLQYQAAGGRLVDDEGQPVIDAVVLAEVLDFYQEARDKGVLDPSVLQHTTTADVWDIYRQGQVGLAEVSSAPYLAGRAEVRETGLGSVPTVGGDPITLVTGWSWALVTGDPQRQSAASALVAWLMEPVNHGTYAQAAGYLPTLPASLVVWGDDPYAPFADGLLAVAIVPPDPTLDSTVGVEMQNAVRDVLLDRASAQEAAAAAAAAVANAQEE